MAEVVSSAASVEAIDAPAAVKVAPQSREETLRGLDMLHVALGDDGATAPLSEGRVAHLTLDVRLQRTAHDLFAQHKLPEAAIVMIDPRTGEVLVYASQAEGGASRDLCAEAKAPSASVFKIVTATALVEHAGLNADSRQCYAGGGDQRVSNGDLEEDPLRDKWCPSLATAMGKSTNTVFARLASKHLDASALMATAHSLGYGAPVPFDVPNDASSITLPEDKLGFARTAAGFWNTTLSPLEAAMLSATVAHDGDAMRPFVVEGAAPEALPRAMSNDAAAAVTTMMEHTITEGTSYRAFHDPRGKAFLPGMTIAGKTGTLNDPDGKHHYSWVTGFLPAHPRPGEAQVAIAVLVINRPKWHVKANVLAREMLQAWTHGPDTHRDTVASRTK